MRKTVISRRDFLRLSVVAAGGVVLAACSSPASTSTTAPASSTEESAATTAPTAAPAKTAASEAATAPSAYSEAPMLAERVAAGELPPIDERLPQEPLMLNPIDGIGKYGGTLNGAHTNPAVFEGWMVASQEGLLTLAVDGVTVQPSVAKAWTMSDDGKELTLTLRAGMKWSDGEPFGADDIIFWWEDVVMNDELTPIKPTFWSPGGEPMTVEKIDDTTVKMIFAAPYTKVVENLAIGDGATPVVYPKHYLQQFHKKYADEAELEAAIEEAGVESWFQLFAKMAQGNSVYYTTAPLDMPTLNPMVVKQNAKGNLQLERNPYYWKVDSAGNQLPYIDSMAYALVQDAEALKLKVLAGEVDWEALQTLLQDYPMFKQNEEAGNYTTLLWNANFAGNICLMFNQTHLDPVKRALFQDKRFRQAMSIGIDRDEINQVIFLGKAIMQQAVANPGTTYYVEEHAKAFTQFDPDAANQLLDEIGLDQLDSEGYRLGTDGNPLDIVFEYWNGHGMQAPAELVADQWRTNLKVKVTAKSIERSLWNERVQSSQHDLTCWLTDKMSQIYYSTYCHWLVPLSTVESAFGTLWAQWYVTGGKEGEEPPEEVKKNIERYTEMQTAGTDDLIRLGKELGQSQAENLWAIGTAALAPMPVVCSQRLGNIPQELANYGNDWMFTVITRPETWFFKE